MRKKCTALRGASGQGKMYSIVVGAREVISDTNILKQTIITETNHFFQPNICCKSELLHHLDTLSLNLLLIPLGSMGCCARVHIVDSVRVPGQTAVIVNGKIKADGCVWGHHWCTI